MALFSDWRRRDRQRLLGKEIYEIKPVVLGGDPTDPKNKTILTREDHIKAVTYWNSIIRDLRKSEGRRTSGGAD